MIKQILLLILLALANVSNGQTFAPIGAKWHYSSSGNGTSPINAEYYLYESVSDTLVAGHACKKISVTYYKYNGAITPQTPVFTYQTGDTVFYYNNIYLKYFPLYIFNVSQGDTLTYHSPTVPVNPADTLWRSVVDSVSNFIVGADTLQRVCTTEPISSAFSFWGGYIELLGSPFLMLHQPHAIFMEWDGPMRCYSDNNISYNFNSYSCDYRLVTGLSEGLAEFEISIFPNPANNILTIKTDDNILTNYKIYNALGQPLLSGQLVSTSTIQIDNFSAGLYVIELTTNNYSKRQTFIINK